MHIGSFVKIDLLFGDMALRLTCRQLFVHVYKLSCYQAFGAINRLHDLEDKAVNFEQSLL